MGEPTVVTAASKFDSRRDGSTQHVDTSSLGWVDRTTPVHSKWGLTRQCVGVLTEIADLCTLHVPRYDQQPYCLCGDSPAADL